MHTLKRWNSSGDNTDSIVQVVVVCYKFLNRILIAWKTKASFDKWPCTKLKTFFTEKEETSQQSEKRHTTEWKAKALSIAFQMKCKWPANTSKVFQSYFICF